MLKEYLKLESFTEKANNAWISSDNISELKFLLWELFQISKWIDDLVNSWNLLSSVILLRTLAERVILFRIIFEDKSKINEQLRVYINHGKIIAYLWMKEDITSYGLDVDYFDDCKSIFDKKWGDYILRKKYNLYKWLLPDRESISFEALYRDYIREPLKKYGIHQNQNFYEIFCHIHHGNSLNLSLLNQHSPFDINRNEVLEESIHNFTSQFLLLIFEIFWEEKIIISP